MNLKKSAPLMIAVLVLGLVLGNVLSSAAAPAADTTAPAGVTGMGLRLGGAMRDAGGRLSDVVAKLTGLDADEVEDQRHGGTSFAAIAKTKGVTSDEIVTEALRCASSCSTRRSKPGTSLRRKQMKHSLDEGPAHRPGRLD